MFLLWSHGFYMYSLQISVLFLLMRVEISLFSSGILGSCGVFLLVKFLYAIEFVCVANPAYWYVFHACLVKYVGECLVCVCRWLECGEGVFCVLCEFVSVCLPVVGI